MNADAILAAALTLTEAERLALVTRLMSTLPEEEITLSLDDPNLMDELDRRLAESDEGIPWEELRDEE